MFIKAHGKNYFGNYLTINGGPLLLLLILIFIIGRYFFGGILSGLGSPQSQIIIANYFENNTGYFIGVGVVFALIALLLSILNISYPIIYLDILSQGKQPTASAIFKGIKARIGRFIVFVLASLITFLPIAALLGGVSILLIIIIIGIPVAFILWAAFSCWGFLSLFDNLTTNRNFFTALGNGYHMLFKNFWAHMGTTAIFLLISFALQMATSLISSLINALVFFVTGENSAEDATIFLIIMFLLSTIVSYFFSSINMLAHGMIYYSCKEDEEKKTMHSEIDLIGTDSE
ncbi:hypothetical protein GR160_04285 [Flavobacterium sp. Sd200]|uniref:hypothetical protein n=1 Tax=Flavobacterium sp. Sd200 TaxID=2692211 RepID=UPI00136C3AAC|nr:hypothetical protein [Flavobacterium sp. Sd200]MXN90436.1 hypothetical protein [Flavobacterium sp. Sd200]